MASRMANVTNPPMFHVSPGFSYDLKSLCGLRENTRPPVLLVPERRPLFVLPFMRVELLVERARVSRVAPDDDT